MPGMILSAASAMVAKQGEQATLWMMFLDNFSDVPTCKEKLENAGSVDDMEAAIRSCDRLVHYNAAQRWENPLYHFSGNFIPLTRLHEKSGYGVPQWIVEFNATGMATEETPVLVLYYTNQPEKNDYPATTMLVVKDTHDKEGPLIGLGRMPASFTPMTSREVRDRNLWMEKSKFQPE